MTYLPRPSTGIPAPGVMKSTILVRPSLVFVFVCLLWVFRPTREFFTHMDTISGGGLQILSNARHLCPLSCKDSLACHTNCDTGHPFIMNTSRTRDTHTYCRAFGSGAVTICFYNLVLWRLGFEHPTFCFRGERSNQLRHAAVPCLVIITIYSLCLVYA